MKRYDVGKLRVRLAELMAHPAYVPNRYTDVTVAVLESKKRPITPKQLNVLLGHYLYALALVGGDAYFKQDKEAG